MRVLQIAPAGVSPFSGVTTALCGLAGALAREGVDSVIWQLSEWPRRETAWRREAAQRAGATIMATPVRSRWGLGREIADRMNASGADVVHLHGVFNAPNWLLARRLTVPYVVSPHGSLASRALEYHSPRKRVARRLAELPMLNGAAIVCALSDLEVDELRRFGVTSPIRRVGNGIDAPPDADPHTVRRRLGLADEPLALFVGRLDLNHKNLEEVVRGLVDAPAWHAAFVGPSFRGGAEELRSLAARLGIANRVHLLGALANGQLFDAYRAADLFVLPSRWEGFPMVLLEAASVGIPALVSEDVEARTRLAASGGGRVVKPGALGASLRSWQSTPVPQRLESVRSALSFAYAHAWEIQVKPYLDVYTDACSGGRRNLEAACH